MSEKERLVVGVDIGTTKICAVVASADEHDRIHVRGVGVADSHGLNRGVVVNIDKTVEAVNERLGALAPAGASGDPSLPVALRDPNP